MLLWPSQLCHPIHSSPAAPCCRSAAAAAGRASRVVCRTSLYDVLGVAQTASHADIRAAYRQAAGQHHPDINSSPAAQEKFKVIHLVADVLTSPELREAYNRRGLAALPGSRYKALHEYIKRARAMGAVALQSEAGGDITTVLGLEFNEAVTGCATTVTTGALGTCPDCKGSGVDCSEAAPPDCCAVCSGSGEIVLSRWQQSGAPRLQQLHVCPACKGGGRSAVQHCPRCAGEGRVQLRRHVRIKVPAGVVDGQVLRVRGQGHMGKYGGAPGDLLVRLQVYTLGDIQRRGDDLHSCVGVALWDALLGGQVSVHTVRGARTLAVPQGTQHGQVLCVRGAGVARPGLNGVEYGHHYFTVSLLVPDGQAAAPDEQLLMQQLAGLVKGRQPGGGLQPQQAIQQWEEPSEDGDGAQQPQQQDETHDARQRRRRRQQANGSDSSSLNGQHSSDPLPDEESVASARAERGDSDDANGSSPQQELRAFWEAFHRNSGSSSGTGSG